jgi:hypothetical protein
MRVLIDEITVIEVKFNKEMYKLIDLTILNRVFKEVLKYKIREFHHIFFIVFIYMLLE